MCVLLQLNSELSLTVVYHGTGGVSGYCSMNLPGLALNRSSVGRYPTSGGSRLND